MIKLIREMRRGILGGVIAGVILAGVAGVSVEAQAPFSAQIQAALRVFLATAHTWTGTQTRTLSGIAAVSTDGIVLLNTTAATAGVPVQMSGRIRLGGAAWNSVGVASESDSMFIEDLPATVAGTTTQTLKFGSIINGGAATFPLTLTNAGALTTLSTATFGGTMQAPNVTLASLGGQVFWPSGPVLATTANGLLNATNFAGTFGPQINSGTAAPTVTTCGTGAVTSHSSNTAGEVTATGATTCTVTFGAPNFTNQPFCTVTDETTAAALRISVISVSAFTVTNLTSGDKFMFTCFGGV